MNKTDNTVNAKIILNKKKIHPKGFMFLDFEKRIEFFFSHIYLEEMDK
jgi:hypothetical protein